MNEDTRDKVRSTVREHYAQVAETESACGCAPSCCGAGPETSLQLGYTAEDLAAVPEGANMGLGCGNPQGLAGLQPGETVVDLGSGGGFDCFLAARQVGPSGHVIGVDMTAAMISKARANAAKLGLSNVEFRLGEIEHQPIPDGVADVLLSNCVINLSPNKSQVFRDAFRVLKPGGRLALSDVVATGPIPAEMREQPKALTGCVTGAAEVREIESMLKRAGFDRVQVTIQPESRSFIREWFPGSGAEEYVASATIHAIKPAVSGCCSPSCCDNATEVEG